MSQKSCKLCLSAEVENFLEFSEKSFGEKREFAYEKCNNCGLVWLREDLILSAEQEKSRYDHHQNDLSQEGYRQHLLRLWEPLRGCLDGDEDLKTRYSESGNGSGHKWLGMDYGCGPQPNFSQLVEGEPCRVISYDPIYFPVRDGVIGEKEDLHIKWPKRDSLDFIFCNEVIEHTTDPRGEFVKMLGLLNTGGYLALGTKLVVAKEDFQNWSYRKDDTHITFLAQETLGFLCSEFDLSLISMGDDWFVFQKR